MATLAWMRSLILCQLPRDSLFYELWRCLHVFFKKCHISQWSRLISIVCNKYTYQYLQCHMWMFYHRKIYSCQAPPLSYHFSYMQTRSRATLNAAYKKLLSIFNFVFIAIVNGLLRRQMVITFFPVLTLHKFSYG